jgi:hypothetical protein
MTQQTLSEQIVQEVTAWAGVKATPGERGELSLRVGGREIGHLHGDRAAHFGFPKQLWQELLDQGRVGPHPIGKDGWAARRLDGPADAREIVALLRLNYERAMARRSVLESVVPGLFASNPEPLPFAPSLDIRAFLLQRERGNLLVYSVADLETGPIDALGGIWRQYLNHRHEAMFAADWVTSMLVVHEDEEPSVQPLHAVGATFGARHTIGEDFEVIPTPGHTPGATAYLWDNGSERVLFTGDTIYLNDGEWVAAVLESSDRSAYLESLGLIRDLDFDVLVPWAASAGGPYHAPTNQHDARARIDAIVERVRGGGNR